MVEHSLLIRQEVVWNVEEQLGPFVEEFFERFAGIVSNISELFERVETPIYVVHFVLRVYHLQDLASTQLFTR